MLNFIQCGSCDLNLTFQSVLVTELVRILHFCLRQFWKCIVSQCQCCY